MILEIKTFNFDKIDAAELRDDPGLYSFFYSPSVADYDLKIDNRQEASQKLNDIVDDKYLKPHLDKSYDASVSVDFEQKLKGRIGKSYKSISKKRFHNQVLDRRFKSEEVFIDQENRLAFRSLMKNITPVFSSPIYVGVASNIKTRLHQHYDIFTSSRNMLINDAQISDEDFGSRLASFAELEEVLVAVQYVDSDILGIKKQSAYELSILSEWIVNQQIQPVLGRR
ncbi:MULTISPECIES: hypothetical protein [Aeromonas]|uniref:hypothetical protein n=1 Tax=Aeromonas TaxID=642 RepID=UPI0011176EBE|nr:hypothetical protein [Aeromonas veronii]